MHLAYLALAEVVQEVQVISVNFLRWLFVFLSSFLVTIGSFTLLTLDFGRLFPVFSAALTVALSGLWQ